MYCILYTIYYILSLYIYTRDYNHPHLRLRRHEAGRAQGVGRGTRGDATGDLSQVCNT